MVRFFLLILFIAVKSISFGQDTIKLSESAYRLKSANYGFKVRDYNSWKLTKNWDSASCYMEIAVPDTLAEAGKPIFKTELIDCKEVLEKHEKDSLTKIFDQAQGHYVKFFYDNGHIQEEGKWYYEYWEGPYKRYYPNAILGEKGTFLGADERHKIILSEKEIKEWADKDWGQKTGKWEYFSKEGKPVKIELFDSKGRLMKTE